MIRKTVYFRDEEDLAKFNALPNKAEWLHERLNMKHDLETGYKAIQVQRQVDQIINEPINTPPEETA